MKGTDQCAEWSGISASLPALDPLQNFAARLVGHFILPHVPPPDEHVVIVKVAKTLAGVVETDGSDLEAGTRAQPFGDLVAEEIVVGFGLPRLALVPYQNLDVGRGKRRGRQQSGAPKRNEKAHGLHGYHAHNLHPWKPARAAARSLRLLCPDCAPALAVGKRIEMLGQLAQAG